MLPHLTNQLPSESTPSGPSPYTVNALKQECCSCIYGKQRHTAPLLLTPWGWPPLWVEIQHWFFFTALIPSSRVPSYTVYSNFHFFRPYLSWIWHLTRQMGLLSVISVLIWQLLLISVLCRVLWECAVDIQLLLLLFTILTVTEVLCSIFLGDVDTGLWGGNNMHLQLPSIRGIQLVL